MGAEGYLDSGLACGAPQVPRSVRGGPASSLHPPAPHFVAAARTWLGEHAHVHFPSNRRPGAGRGAAPRLHCATLRGRRADAACRVPTCSLHQPPSPRRRPGPNFPPRSAETTRRRAARRWGGCPAAGDVARSARNFNRAGGDPFRADNARRCSATADETFCAPPRRAAEQLPHAASQAGVEAPRSAGQRKRLKSSTNLTTSAPASP